MTAGGDLGERGLVVTCRNLDDGQARLRHMRFTDLPGLGEEAGERAATVAS